MNPKGSLFKTAVFLTAIILLVALTPLREPVTGFSRNALYAAVYPLQLITYRTATGIRYFFVSILTLRSAQSDNDRLRKKLAAEAALNDVLAEVVRENSRLRSAAGFRSADPFRINPLSCETIARSPSNWFSEIQIDRGQSDGVRPGNAVVSSSGLVGRVVEAAPSSSRVLLIIDEQSRVSVRVQRTGEIGVLAGAGSEGAVLKYISANSDIKPGDLLVTSGISDYYAKGIPVGYVSETGKKDQDLFQRIKVKTAADFFRLSMVFVSRYPK